MDVCARAQSALAVWMFLLLLLGASITAMVGLTGCGADSNGHSRQLQQTYDVTVTGTRAPR
jgi:hypothetical protein